MSKKKLFVIFFLFIFSCLGFFSLHAAPAGSKNVIQGRIVDGRTSQPVVSALVIVKEAGVVSAVNQNGFYRAELPAPGNYSVTIRAQGLNELTAIVLVDGIVTKDFILNAAVSGGSAAQSGSLIVRGNRDLQTISRQTMTIDEIKAVPATFGDSVSALSALAGINRVYGFFGPLVIRGAYSDTNAYYLDDIPLFKITHFGGIHSVIANNLMSSIDVYSSSFPAQFVGPMGAVININTVDDVQKPGGYADVGFISANALVQFPITKTTYIDGKEKIENRGYVIASGRVGYLSLFIPLFYEHVMNKELDYLPQYWDYQLKAKYEFNKRHSLTFLAFGSKDKIDLQMKDSWMEDEDDPLFSGVQMYNDDQSHSFGFSYKFKPTERFSNTLLAFAARNEVYTWMNVPSSTAAWAHDLGVKSTPAIYGLKESIFLEWWERHAALRAGAEVRYYHFKTAGNTIHTNSSIFDMNDPNFVELIALGKTYRNLTVSGYAENRFTFGGLTLTPGVAYEYLERNGKSYVDPRGLASYSFKSGTTIGVAGGYYSMFIQTMPDFFTVVPNVSALDFGASRSVHRAASIEQDMGGFSVKIEGYYNTYEGLVNEDQTELGYINDMKYKSGGVEFSAKINNDSPQGFFGWLSYTYNKAKEKSGQSDAYAQYFDHAGNLHSYGDDWLTSYVDMTHVLKLILGYTFGKNTVSGKFQFNSVLPHTPIVYAKRDLNYVDPSGSGRERWVPGEGKPYSDRLSPEYRLDLRYSRQTNYKWGYVSWYIEAIGLISSKAENYVWDYRYDYSASNPKTKKSNSLTIVPNFGIETKF